ncbi:lysine-rich nucleolar protein 1 isoform X1 [Molossus molossus]|nr:lysine-rich nucleolar protein 1 isoform X1 [Molossus molossus]
MITKTHKGDLGLSEKNKKKKKKKKKKKVMVKEPETQYSVLNSNNCFTEVCPTRAMSPAESVIRGQAPEVPLMKKKEKKKKDHSTICKEHQEPETTLRAKRTEKSPSPRIRALGLSEFLSGKKRKKGKSLGPLAMSSGLRVKTSLDPRQGEEVTRVCKKLKKNKKEKKAQEATVLSARDPGLYEAGATLQGCSLGKDDQEQITLGHKRKQGSPRKHNVKMKKKKKVHQEGDTTLGHPKPSRSMESSPRKGSKKKPATAEASECIPMEDGLRSPVKKKKKSSHRAEEPAPRRKKRKRKESKGAGGYREEGCWGRGQRMLDSYSLCCPAQEPDTDLEVVLEKKGNMDETHIDQMRRKALQEEIDRESGKTEASETWKWTGTQFGQWDTAGFENEEQKLKFLKLMGGFKNLSPSLSRTPDMVGRPSMALNKKAADALQRSLQQDYDRALRWKYSWGAGLGFPTAPRKAFYIDRNASKSVKFED